jgi:uncharacterized membrane protein
MPLGEVELLIVQFPKSQLKGDIVPALKELVEGNVIRIIDLIFLKKDQQGQVTTIEFNDLDDADFAAFDSIVSEITSLISEDDVTKLSEMLENDSSAGLMLFENTWASRLSSAVANVHGRVLLNDRIPHVVIEQLIAAKTQMPSQIE